MASLGSLLIFFVALLVLVAVGSIALLFVKNKIAYNVVFTALAVITVGLSVLGATSIASNFIFEQIVAWFWGLMALCSLGLHFTTAQHARLAKYLLLFAAVASVIDLIFI